MSGRSTLVLNDDKQVDPNSIYFGFRGGRLDLNGNSLTFDHIRNIDDGARVVNHNMTNTSNITITGESLITNPNTITSYNIEAQDDDHPLRIRSIPYRQLYFNQDNRSYYTLKKVLALVQNCLKTAEKATKIGYIWVELPMKPKEM